MMSISISFSFSPLLYLTVIFNPNFELLKVYFEKTTLEMFYCASWFTMRKGYSYPEGWIFITSLHLGEDLNF